MYKKASKMKLRFTTSRGELTVEQLWSLSLTSLIELIKASNDKLEEFKASDNLSFLSDTVKPVDEKEQLRFDILKDIFVTKKTEAEQAVVAREKKERNQKIQALIAEKEEDGLRSLTKEELQKLLEP